VPASVRKPAGDRLKNLEAAVADATDTIIGQTPAMVSAFDKHDGSRW
jgi:hypothetical protein